MYQKRQKDAAIDYIKTEIDMLIDLDNSDEIIKSKNHLEMTLLLLVKLEIFGWDQAQTLARELSVTSRSAIDCLEHMKKIA
ncbi:hypothetical protein [Acinetobacter genomosp. 15BJ]|uniref:Uncharacterized protein n=1 Tax=Acinetobacter genomosp. 15BJ TaxID=106651 RepID=R9B2E4_9GAMM|nr:hypothetical protein [Acinetobacter genomosp. 15BJ]EOR08450.1 hypothetical protein F896_01748 [Acinetobacter genomosp. 15BJ]MCH7290513.1 hypothetical protein [Acinetobacter genomosp. 15BJ]MDO3657030.1 hypothetical protein [Acinetobacter genomosp. 15BJ]